MITGDAVLADRKARNLPRGKYGELVGLSAAQIGNIEKGRKIRDDEARKLESLIMQNVVVDTASVNTDATRANGEFHARVTVVTEPGIELLGGEDLDDPDVAEPEFDIELTQPDLPPVPLPLPTTVGFTYPGYHVSNSELQTFKRCLRKWYLAYYRELKPRRPEVTGARSIGTRVHLALAVYYSTSRLDPMLALESTIQEDEKLLVEHNDLEALAKLRSEADLARIMMRGYMDWVAEEGKDAEFDIIGDEMVVESPFLTAEQVNWDQPVVLVGKLDIRIRDKRTGARLFMDHKTVGSLTAPQAVLAIDEQMLHYHLLEYLECLKTGSKEYSQGGLYNMLRKVKRTAAAKPPFYERVEVYHNIHELQSYWMRVLGEVTRLIEVRKQLDAGADHRQIAYPSPRSTCSWDCDFKAVCPMFDDGSSVEQALNELYVRGDPHEHYKPYGDVVADRDES